MSASPGDGGILITWQPPLTTEVPIFRYSIEYSSIDDQWEKVYTEGVETSFLFTEGHPGVTYRFRVYANALLAYSNPSTVISYTVPEGKISDDYFHYVLNASLYTTLLPH